MRTQPAWLGPLQRVNGQRVTDRVIGGTYMRGGYNFTVRDGEWWSRKGEECLKPTVGGTTYSFARVASTPWWWMFDVNRELTVICNPWYALKIEETGFTKLTTAVKTETVTFTNGSAVAVPTTSSTANRLMLVGTQPTTEVYRVIAASGTGPYSLTMDRAYEGTSGAKTVEFVDSYAKTFAVTPTAHDDTARIIGNACVFEQLGTFAAGEFTTLSPAVTAGHLYLIITSNQGTPIAIDLTSTGAVLRNWFALTNLGPTTGVRIGSDTATDGLTPRGVYSAVYKNRLFIGGATDPSGQYGSRTLYHSSLGNFVSWHTGNVDDETAVANYKTFDGEGNSIGGMAILGDDLVIHRDDSQEICSATQSGDTPFVFRTNNENLGVRDFRRSNRIVAARGRHFIWTRRGPFAFDGRNLNPLAEDARGLFQWQRFMQVREAIRHVRHDAQNGLIYWFSANSASRWDEYATPASANYTTVDGNTLQNYYGVFVYNYEDDTYWFEDRPVSLGGGMMTIDQGRPAQLHVSRSDGTIIILNGRSKGQDAALSTYNGSGVVVNDPADADDDVFVMCVAETPWMDFGSPTVKRLTRIETHERGLSGEGLFDNYGDADEGKRALRIQIYGDMNPATVLADVSTAYDSTDATTSAQLGGTNVAQAQTFIREFTPRADARQFKFVFSNIKSAGAIWLSWVNSPVRLSDVFLELAPLDSLQPKTTVTDAATGV